MLTTSEAPESLSEQLSRSVKSAIGWLKKKSKSFWVLGWNGGIKLDN
jgi:hypothetical protein